MIKRKPVPRSLPTNVEQKLAQESVQEVTVLYPSSGDGPPSYDSDTDESLVDFYLSSEVEEPSSHLHLEIPPDGFDTTVVSASSTSLDDQAATTETKSAKVKHALETAFSEAKHFAGGLIPHPHESTRHYTILRHSFGLVYYRGPTTSVVITIFSDRPLPDDRTMWLQKRGYSGKTGLTFGAAFGTRGAWINVTPVAQTTLDQLPTDQERAWQRDIFSFSKKVQDLKYVRDHTPRETNILRIPHAVEDGYFRVVLCSGRSVLCSSPTFRYASTSADPGLLRGASPLTLPLEMGLKVGARVATTAAIAATNRTLGPATAVAQTVSRQADWAPIHLFGVRGGSAGLQDQNEGHGGVSVTRG